MPRNLEWAAGLFEGEGTIIIRSSRPKSKAGNIEISLSSTDKDVVVEFHRVVGRGHIYGPYQYKTNRKPYWKYTCGGDEAAAILTVLQPWFCLRRHTRSIQALHAHDERQKQPFYRSSRAGIGGRPTHVT